jgi:hypothetical protein
VKSAGFPRTARWGLLSVFIGLLLAAGASEADAQSRFGRGSCSQQGSIASPSVPYDGRFTLPRIPFVDWSGGNNWCNDYPDMERNFVLILREITSMKPIMGASNLVRFDDPELFKFPMVYLTEPGFWSPDDAEIKGLRDYMAKGGFVFFDDFNDNQWNNFEAHFRRAVPNAEFFRLDSNNPIFDSFYKIDNLAIPYPSGNTRLTAEFYAVYKDNDPNKAMWAIISYNSDLGDYMEWSGTGRNPINLANEAYKFAVNFVIFGMTR